MTNDKLPEIEHLKAEVKRLNESCHQYSTRCIHFLQQAQRMAEALDYIANTAQMDGYVLKNVARKSLQQFRDGAKGKEWQPIVTAPKDGSTIEVSYDKEGKEACLACWSEERICMAGPPMGCCGAGWATSPDSDTDTNLPLDPPSRCYVACFGLHKKATNEIRTCCKYKMVQL